MGHKSRIVYYSRKTEGSVRMMNTDQLLKTLPVLQQHLDALLDFDCTASELNNGVINAAFMLLFRDLIRLFACYNDGIINLLEKFFEMNKKQCRDALDCYKKFLIRMDRVSEFLKVAESVGMDKSEIPDLKQAPSSLLDALEGHLASLEGKKPPTGTTSNGTSAVEDSGASISAVSDTTFALDEVTKQQALAEEEAMYARLRAEAAKNNPFLSSPDAAPQETAAVIPIESSAQIDIFSAELEAPAAPASSKASDDLLQLAGNPFADLIAATPAPFVPQPVPQQPLNVLGGLGDILTPESGLSSTNTAVPPLIGQAPPAPAKLISGDLDSSLSSLVDNLNIKGPAVKTQWSSPKTPNKTGGATWTPPQPTQVNFTKPMMPPQFPAATGAPIMPMGGMMPQTIPTSQPQQPAAAFDPFSAL
ncbi:hypothetical protein HAZT_HAZT008100 [Hyalella azteca]|uniref:AP180 N-terminal homology (ANTH) domain-containing protein n=1 Tax=Hyalella azteca TaxID=294128 RepID=A0A6A0HDU3_HYAAZ|nr:hypothetical protein HAZT_HAZT008100 [Hyalella azteca]